MDASNYFLETGLSLLNYQHYSEALAALLKVPQASLRNEHEQKTLHMGIGSAYWGMEKYEEAIAEFRAASHLDPNDPEPYLSMAHVHKMTGTKAAEQSTLREAASVPVDCSGREEALGYLSQYEGNYEAALGHMRRAEQMAPAKGDIPWAIGNTLFLLKRYEEAAAAFERTLLFPAAKEDRSNQFADLGRTRLLLGQTEAAKEAFAEALRLFPETRSVFRVMLLHYRSTRQYGKALVLILNALRQRLKQSHEEDKA